MTTGVRTGKYRLGKDDMLFDDKGESFISVEDYAVAMVDELEQENHHKERFTAAYYDQITRCFNGERTVSKNIE